MMSDSTLRLKVASPCSADLDAMDGDDRCRFCSLCQKNVYNLTELSDAESQQLIKDRGGKVCVRFFQRHDGTVLTSDCPVGAADGRRRIRKRVTALAFAGFVAAGIWNFARQASSSQTADPKELVVDRWIEDIRQLIGLPARNTPSEELIMGDVCLPDEDLLPTDGTPATLPAVDDQIVESSS